MIDVGPIALDLPMSSIDMSPGEPETTTLLVTELNEVTEVTEMIDAALGRLRQTSIVTFPDRKRLRLNLWSRTLSRIH